VRKRERVRKDLPRHGEVRRAARRGAEERRPQRRVGQRLLGVLARDGVGVVVGVAARQRARELALVGGEAERVRAREGVERVVLIGPRGGLGGLSARLRGGGVGGLAVEAVAGGDEGGGAPRGDGGDGLLAVGVGRLCVGGGRHLWAFGFEFSELAEAYKGPCDALRRDAPGVLK